MVSGLVDRRLEKIKAKAARLTEFSDGTASVSAIATTMVIDWIRFIGNNFCTTIAVENRSR